MMMTAISSIVFLLTLLPLILLILATTSEPFSEHLQISQLFDADGKILVDMGVFGVCAQGLQDISGFFVVGARCGRRSPNWFVRARLPVGPDQDGNPVPSPAPLVRQMRALSLITVPIASGMVGFVLVFFVAAWSGGTRKWARTLNIINFSFYVITTFITWLAFGFCLDLTKRINRSLEYYNRNPKALLAVPLVGKPGNATWLVLTAAILILIATVLYGFKAFRKPKIESDFHVDGPKVSELEQGQKY